MVGMVRALSVVRRVGAAAGGAFVRDDDRDDRGD